MKEIIKRDWPYLLLAVVLVICSILSIDSFKYGFYTTCDQSYMLLKLREAYDGSYITGKSQWNLIAVHMFPYLDLTNKASSFLAASILNWITVLLGTITACLLFDKRRFIMYFALIFLLCFHNAYNGQGLSYITMQGAFLCWAVCFLMLLVNRKNDIWKYVCAFMAGISLSLSCLTILPGGVAVSACVCILVIWMNYKEPAIMWKSLLSGLGGFLAVLGYVHLFVCPINDIVAAMAETSKFFTKADHYDGHSMFFMFFFFFRDFLFLIVSFIGIYFLSQRIDNKIVGKLFYVLFSLVFVYFCNRDSGSTIRIGAFMAISSIAFIPYLFQSNITVSAIDWRNSRTYYYIFLFMFPIIAVLGTNTGVLGRLYFFVMVWLFLFFKQTYTLPRFEYGELLITVMLFFTFPCAYSINSSIPNVVKDNLITKKNINTCHFEKGNANFATIAITQDQYDYYNRIYSILSEYNFVPHQSTIFATAFDDSNIYVFDAVNASHFHSANFFQFVDISRQDAPDFLFMCRMDSMILSERLRNSHWDWPDAYDEFSVGGPKVSSDPEWINRPDVSTRYMYCRKSLKSIE